MRRIPRRNGHPLRASLEPLEPRAFLAATPVGMTPAQIRHAYSFDTMALTGAGQTIAIVDPYLSPTIFSDLQTFSRQFGLLGYGSSSQVLTVKNLGATTVDAGWALEAALDVEWAHAIAPGAKIVLVQARSSYNEDLVAAVNYARRLPGVTVVSMSWGGTEFSTQTSYDSTFMTPSNHIGVTFVAAAGDNGGTAGWPAVSANVLAVGGTSLTLFGNNTRRAETAWANSGGGFSTYVAEPSYQNSVTTMGLRSNPDVSYNGNPDTGFATYTATAQSDGSSGWIQMGGTSAGTPQWSALIALANQKRVRGGKASLDGPAQTLPMLYSFKASDFFDVVSGSNGHAAAPGYDQATGRGSPVASRVVNDLFLSNLYVKPAASRFAVTTTNTSWRNWLGQPAARAAGTGGANEAGERVAAGHSNLPPRLVQMVPVSAGLYDLKPGWWPV